MSHQIFVQYFGLPGIFVILGNIVGKRFLKGTAPAGSSRMWPAAKNISAILQAVQAFEELKRWSLRDVRLEKKAEVYTPVYWKGVKY